MRLWSLSPVYLDTPGLLAAWREGLLAQKVLCGQTRGYRNHPQLLRFQSTTDPLKTIGWFLAEVFKESVRRGYDFQDQKILEKPDEAALSPVPVTEGQIQYEWNLLRYKLFTRSPEKFQELKAISIPHLNPVFFEIPGSIENFEKVLPVVMNFKI